MSRWRLAMRSLQCTRTSNKRRFRLYLLALTSKIPMMDEAKAWGAAALNVLSTPLPFNRRIVIERATVAPGVRDILAMVARRGFGFPTQLKSIS